MDGAGTLRISAPARLPVLHAPAAVVLQHGNPHINPQSENKQKIDIYTILILCIKYIVHNIA